MKKIVTTLRIVSKGMADDDNNRRNRDINHILLMMLLGKHALRRRFRVASSLTKRPCRSNRLFCLSPGACAVIYRCILNHVRCCQLSQCKESWPLKLNNKQRQAALSHDSDASYSS